MFFEAFSDFDNKMTSGDDTVAESESEGYQTDLQVGWLITYNIHFFTLYLNTNLVENKAA